MKLLSINNYHYLRDGSEAVYLNHNAWLSESGYKVSTFAMEHPENLPSPTANYFVRDIELGQEYSIWQKLVRVPKVIYSLEARSKLDSLITKTQPDLVHCHSIYHHISPSILSLISDRGIPCVMTLHDLKLSCPAYHMHTGARICEDCRTDGLRSVVRNRCIKDSLPMSLIAYAEAKLHHHLQSYRNNVALFISPCKFYIDKLVEWGWEREKFLHVPNALDPAAYALSAPVTRKSFLYFGRLSPEKGLSTLIDAAALANVEVLFAGDGPLRRNLEEYAIQKNAKVQFLGKLNKVGLALAVENCCATILPSEWYENASISILESFAWGRPVLASAIGGNPEQIDHQANGILFEPGNVVSLANALSELAELPIQKLTEMGLCARQTLERKFNRSNYVERINATYDKAMKTNAIARG